MLSKLEITNYAIIDHAVIGFAPDLTVISGETGAGKSIMLGALALILGKRAESGVLRDVQSKCIVEGTFFIANYQLQTIFEQQELEYIDETIIRREIHSSGKSRAFINDTPVTLNILELIAVKLVQIHSQHETLDLASSRFQMLTLDSLAGHTALLEEYVAQFQEWSVLKSQLAVEIAALDAAKADQDYLQFQLDEMEAANLQSATPDAWEEELKVLSHADDVQRQVSESLTFLEQGEYNAISFLRSAITLLDQIASYNPNIPPINERMESLAVELQEIIRDLESLAEQTKSDPERAEQLNEQLSRIFLLYRKHKVQQVADLQILEQQFADRHLAIQTGDDRIRKMEEQLKNLLTAVYQNGNSLLANRKKAALLLSKEVVILLSKVGMKDAKLEVSLPLLPEPTPNGIHSIDFHFSANKGMPLKEIGKVASGGELSRLMLCIKSLLAAGTALPTLLFDEIDTGVSGAVADQVGHILEDLSSRHQVIAITHLPQIASKGKHHLLVKKSESAGKASTEFELLSAKDRIQEIARMLSGETAGAAAIQNAQHLLGNE